MRLSQTYAELPHKDTRLPQTYAKQQYNNTKRPYSNLKDSDKNADYLQTYITKYLNPRNFRGVIRNFRRLIRNILLKIKNVRIALLKQIRIIPDIREATRNTCI